MLDGQCEVLVVESPGGVVQACKVCGQVLSTGTFMVGIHVREDGKDFKYLLGSPEQEHCGERKHLVECFDLKEEAEQECARVTAHILERHSTEGLPLKGFVMPSIY